eukprot:m.22413 g.22413  ORF g.22413 m.22413 type:complete len:560 (+) comp3984_c0_seq2:2-1681(+)
MDEGPAKRVPHKSTTKDKTDSAAVTCRPRIPPGLVSARRIERAILYAEMGYYIFFLLAVPTLLWRYGDTLRHDLGFGSGDPICDDLTKWILEGGGMIDGSRCIYTPEGGGRGIVATTRLSHRQTYSVVPLTLCMWEQTVKEHCPIATDVLINDPVVRDYCGHPWGPNSTADPWRLILAMDYEHQLGEKSYWAAFIRSMPVKPTSPLWWTDEQMDEMQSPRISDEIVKLKESIKEAYDVFFPHLTDAHPELYAGMNITLESFTWASLQVWGRAFDASANDPNDKSRRTWMMVPFIDLVNHQSYVGSFYGDEEATVGNDEKAFSCWATECFTAGAEIFQSYGSHKSSTHYFLYYGFVPMGFEQADFVSFTVDPDVEARFAKNTWKMGYAGADGRITEGFLHQFVRAVVIQRKLAQQGLTLEQGEEKAIAASSAEVLADQAAWRAVLQYILGEVEDRLANLPTTLEEDEHALDNLEFEYDRWVTLTIRVRFKRLLHTVRSNLKYRLESEVNNLASWEYAEQGWSIVYQLDTVNQRRSKALQHETLFEIEMHPDIPALASVPV